MDALTQALARVQGSRVYIDANIFIYFFEEHPEYFSAVKAFFELFNSRHALMCTGDAAVAEVLYKPYQKNDAA